MSLATRDTDPILKYIAKRKDSEMRKWDVFIPSVARNIENYSFKTADLKLA